MTTPVTFPDAAACAVTILNAALTPTVYTRVPNPRPATFVRLSRDGGIRRSVVVDQATLVVECWAASEEAAQDLAQLARAALHAAEATTVGSYGTVYRVDEVAGLSFAPDPESDQPCYRFTVSLALRGV